MYTLPALSYEYDALQPYVSEEIMCLHHQKHHQTYVDTLNTAMEEAPEPLQGLPIEELLGRLHELPDAIRTTVRNNGGGHYNHTLFWQCMTPGGSRLEGDLRGALEAAYDSINDFKKEFAAKAKGVFGSGWVWLMPDLSIVTSPNQDSPVMDAKAAPLLGLDVWEHAYYLDYKNVRPDYIDAWWQVVDWNAVAQRYAATMRGE
ncbi:MAG: superoxide dismutase [Candidatus Saccharimonadales bacterium]